jgi:gluconate 2-dehydrogenase subunit 3-like protein
MAANDIRNPGEPQQEAGPGDDRDNPRSIPGEPARPGAPVYDRRRWMLRLGEAAVLVGYSGLAGDELAPLDGLAAEVLAGPPIEEPAPASLPPGLYEPSQDHMTHALTADERFHPIPPGSETDFIRPRAGPFQPQFFSPPQFEVVKRLVELVLGEEKSPAGSTAQDNAGGASAEIAEWIDLVVFNSAAVRGAARKLSAQQRALAIAYYGSEAVHKLETEDWQKTWREGLQWLAEESARRYGKGFLDLSKSQQVELFTSISDERLDKTLSHAGTRLFALLKTQVIRGFYTSQAGLKGLNYKGNTFYVDCPGCSNQQTGE